MASRIVQKALINLEEGSPDCDITVVDFCSGSGGPASVIEKTINRARLKLNQDPVHFVLSDLFPPVEHWVALVEQSVNLGFITQPVDAIDPPAAAMSNRPLDSQPSSSTAPRTKVFRLYCLSFHHFDDDAAMEILVNTMATADGFAVIELQERRISSLILMVFQCLFSFIVQLIWFWRRPLNLLYTYFVPVLPFIMGFDGVVSSLRTRTLEELLDLVIASQAAKFDAETILSSRPRRSRIRNEQLRPIQLKGWNFRGGRKMHTFPFGYMTWFVGTRM